MRDLALHQLALLDDVLDLARLEHGSVPLRTEPVDAIRVLGVVAEAAFPLVQRGGNRLCLAVEGEEWVLADETRLRQVLLNLVGNATKFTHDGLVALGATARNGSVSLHVRDTGCGMTPADVERVFRPFQQANAVSAVVRRLGARPGDLEGALRADGRFDRRPSPPSARGRPSRSLSRGPEASPGRRLRRPGETEEVRESASA